MGNLYLGLNISGVFLKMMRTRQDLPAWVVEALKDLNGSAQIRKVIEHVWEHHDREIIDSGNFHFTWQEDIYWAATQLRAKGILKNAKATSKNTWALEK